METRTPPLANEDLETSAVEVIPPPPPSQIHLGNFENTLWNEEIPQREKKSKKFLRVISYILLGIFSFLFFLYFTFPYGVLKEVLVVQVADNMGRSGMPIRLSIGSLKPYWFTGVQLQNVNFTNRNESKVSAKFPEITARLQLLPLLIGKVKVNAEITQAKGNFEASVTVPILSLVRGTGVPSSAEIQFTDFSLEPFLQHGIAIVKQSKDTAAILIGPLLAKTTAGGSLFGKLNLENADTSSFARAIGTVKLNLQNGYLHIADETLKIPRQNFKTANLDLRYESAAISFGKDSKFSAEDLDIGLSGKIDIPETPGTPPIANLELELGMRGQIEKNLGQIITSILRCKPLSEGKLIAKLTGPLGGTACE
jgi:type II secretion system protein N